MSEWQPIETYEPGSYVDLWGFGPGKDAPIEYYRVPSCWRREDGVWFSMYKGELKQTTPTHWMREPRGPEPQ